MIRLYWVRHGENPANLTKEFSSRRVDYSLTAKGVLQASQTACYFGDHPVQAIYASPLKRASETAAIIAGRLGQEVTILEEFREIDVGDLEQRPPTVETWAFHNQILDDWLSGKPERAFPGGENYFQVWERLQRGLDRITAGAEGQAAAVVSHGGILAVTLPDLCPGTSLEWLRSADNPNCAVTEILLEKQGGRFTGQVAAWATCAHLHGEAANLVRGTLDTTSSEPS